MVILHSYVNSPEGIYGMGYIVIPENSEPPSDPETPENMGL